MLNCFVLLLSFTGVISAPIQSITDIMKNDARLCNATKFLYDSKYTKPCASLEYPTASSNFDSQTVNNFLCLGVYDTAYKICQYSKQFSSSFNNTTISLYVESLVAGDNEEIFNETLQQEFCKNLNGITLYNKTSPYLEPLIKYLNKLDKCQKICFDFDNKLDGPCAVLGWIKNFENNMEKSNRNSNASTQLYDNLHDKTSAANKAPKGKEIEESTGKQTTKDLKDDKKFIPNISDNAPNMNRPNTEKETSNFDESIKDKSQKTADDVSMKASNENNMNDNKSGTNVEAAQIKNMPTNNEISSKNNAGNNVPNNDYVNEGKPKEEPKKKQNIDVTKSSTLSENTQDHVEPYEANMEDEIENGDMNDIDDSVQQPNNQMGGNPNEKEVQEVFEKNNLRFPNLRTEDDSHFFTYFTVIAAMCIIGYIGYCNKQKIFAIVLEGRRSKNNRGRRRPSTASYRKLDCTLEEAVTSQCNANVTHVIY